MIHKVLCCALLSGGLFLTSCGNQPAGQTETETPTTEVAAAMDESVGSEWDGQMEAYHDVMSGTFHPAEEGNLAPLKERYQELSDRAAAWAAVAIPEKHQGKNLEELMKKLVEGSQKIGQMVVNASTDEELTEAMVGLHDIFHGIVGACND